MYIYTHTHTILPSGEAVHISAALSLMVAFMLPPSVSLTHPRSHMSLRIDIVLHKHSGGEERGMVRTSDGNELQLESHPKVIPAAPNMADGPSCYRDRAFLALSTGQGASLFAFCSSSLTAPDFCALRLSHI